MAEEVLRDELVYAAKHISTATAHEAAGKTGALPPSIQPLSPALRLCGRALPVLSPPGDNLFLHHAIYAGSPGEILVVDTSGAADFGYWGEVMTLAAQMRGLAGLVITGAVRDSERLIEMGFPVFSTGRCILGTGKDPSGRGQIGAPIRIGDVEVRHRDIVLGDADGVMILPEASAGAIITESKRRDCAEQEIFARLRANATTLEIYRLPAILKAEEARTLEAMS